MINEDLLFSAVGDLGTLLKTRQISPVELTEAYLSRLERLGPTLNAVVTVTRQLAIEQARQAEQEIRARRYRGPLHGIPYGAKDLVATRGIPTTWGAAPYRDQVFDYDATCIRRLRDAGAVLVAKLAMVELAGGFGYNNPDASFTGPGRNPWNLGFWSGGSSSGPASAVPTALVGFAIGSETGGSILLPAAYCGLSGFRPTFGLVSRHGAMALSWTLDKLGPMCRTAHDCGLVLAAIAGADPADPFSAGRGFEYPRTRRRRAKRVRLGVPEGMLDRAEPDVQRAFADALTVLARDADIVSNVALPQFPPMMGLILRAESASALGELIASGRSRELTNPRDRLGGYVNTATLAVDYLDAMRVRMAMKHSYASVWKTCDALIAPTMNGVATPIDANFGAGGGTTRGGPPAPPRLSLLQIGNLLGVPGLAFMNGLDRQGLPTSMQVVGPAWSDGDLVEIGKAYQQATDWHTRRPALREASAVAAGATVDVPWEDRV
ncbi:MAG: amidase [Vicinamibacterales bacterium]